MRSLRTLVLFLAAFGCGPSGEAAIEPPSTPPPSTSPPSTVASSTPPAIEGPPSATSTAEPTPERPSALDTATACERARACCPAFVDAIGEPVEAERARIACEQMEHLSELGEASGEACLAALDGWRRALELEEREVPLACR